MNRWQSVVRNALLQLLLVHQLHPFLDQGTLQRIIHALVTSQLNYYNMLCMGLSLKTTQIPQLVQNSMEPSYMRDQLSPILSA